VGTEAGTIRRCFEAMTLRRAASRTVVRLAYPVALGMLSYTLLNVVDTAMLGRLGPTPLAAAGVAGVLFFALSFPLSGISVGVQALVARRYGEEQREACGEVLETGLTLAVSIGVPMALLASWLAAVAAPILSSDPAVAALGRQYLRLRLFGTAFMLGNTALRGFFAGIGHTRQQLYAALLVTAVNVLLDTLLIFGYAGFPAMGIEGAALASTIALGCGTVYLVATTLKRRYRVEFGIYRRLRPSLRHARPVVRLSLPVIGQRLVSNGSWFAFFTVVARIGTLELAATNVMRSIYNLSVMPAFGVATAAATLVGQRLGSGEPQDAERLAWEAAKLSAYLMAAVGIVFLAFPRAVFLVYTADPAVIAVGALPLRLLGPVQALAAVAIVLSSSLQGAGCTRFVMLAELGVCFGLYLPVVFFLGLHTPLRLIGAWTGEYVYWTALALLMSTAFRRGSWQRMKI